MATPSDEELSPEEKLLKVIQKGNPDSQTVPGRAQPAAEARTSHVPPVAARPKLQPAAPPAPAARVHPSGPAKPAQVPAFKPQSTTLPGHAGPAARTGGSAQGKIGAPAPAGPGEKKLALQQPAAEPKAASKPRVLAPTAVQLDVADTRTRPKPRVGAVSSLRIVNRAIAAAALLLFVVVVLELTAAKPVLPKPPENTGSPVVFPGAIVPPQSETNYIDPSLRNVWVMGALDRKTTNGPALPPKFEQVMRYVSDNVKLEGVAPGDEGQAFAAITEKGITRYLRKGAVIAVSVDGGTEKITLDRITKNEAVFMCGDRPITIKGVK